jgi:hypothetical protein
VSVDKEAPGLTPCQVVELFVEERSVYLIPDLALTSVVVMSCPPGTPPAWNPSNIRGLSLARPA